MSYNIIKTIKAKRFSNNKFEEIDEKVIDDIYLDIYINNCLVQSIITINEDLEYLSYGTIFLGTDLQYDYILNNLRIKENRCEIFSNDINYNLKCCCQLTNPKKDDKKSLIDKEYIDIKPEYIFKMYKIFDENSTIFKETAGLHSASIFDTNANLIYFAKDIARHNCISKVAGFIIKNIDMAKNIKFIFLSCRVNDSIVKMIKKIGFSNIITKSTFSYLGIKEANLSNINLIGFVRENRFTKF